MYPWFRSLLSHTSLLRGLPHTKLGSSLRLLRRSCLLRIAASKGPLRLTVRKRCNPYRPKRRRDHLNPLFHWQTDVSSSRDPGLRIRGHSVERLPLLRAGLPLVGCRLSAGVCYQTLSLIAIPNGVLVVAASVVVQDKYVLEPPLHESVIGVLHPVCFLPT